MTRSRPGSDQVRLDVVTYLAREERSQIRHEYVSGEIYAMTGATFRHMKIAQNVLLHLTAAAKGGPCQVYTHDAKVRPAEDVFYYPDVIAICEPHDQSATVTTAPCLIVEITSRSTARIDRGEKVDRYREIESLRAYLIIDQDRKRVTRHWRDAGGSWLRADVLGSGSVQVPCPATELTLDEIYEGVELPPPSVAEPQWDEESAGSVATE